MIYTKEAVKLNYSLNIILGGCILLYITYISFDFKESIYILKVFCAVYILLEIVLKIFLNHIPLHIAALLFGISVGSDQEEYKRRLLGQNSESHLLTESSSIFRSRSKCKIKLVSLASIFYQSVASIIFIHITIILFGAYLVHQFDETFTLSLLLATLIFIRPLILFGSSALLTFGEDWNWSNPCQVQGLFVLFGAWLGAFTIPLDWDRSWQAWPLPCVFGSLLGELLSSSLLLLRELKKPKKLV